MSFVGKIDAAILTPQAVFRLSHALEKIGEAA
nr:MAG TPA: hypothetical protein [Caudoviricetes sp.]